MLSLTLPLILICYLVSVFSLGKFIVKRWFDVSKNSLFEIISAILVGLLLATPVTYFLACFFAWTGEGVSWGVISFTLITLVTWAVKYRRKQKRDKAKITINELLLLFFCLLFGFWLMGKSFFEGPDRTWYVSSNTVFDTAHTLSLIRSFSWGNNLPFSSPFAAGSTDLYHFFFYFLVAVFERFGVPLILAFNSLSAVSFAIYLLLAYYFTRLVLEKKPSIGWLTVLLLLTHSTMTWWFFVRRFGLGVSSLEALWRLPRYLFSGPYDGSIISIFFTLNVFVNQRHLAISLAMALWLVISLILLLRQNKLKNATSAILGIATGALSLWNLAICLTVTGVIILLLLMWKKIHQAIYFFLSACLTGLVLLGPSLKEIMLATSSVVPVFATRSTKIITLIWEQARFWALNLGVGMVIFLLGFFVISPQVRKSILPSLVIFVPLALGMAAARYEIAQKMLSFWNVIFVSLSACGLMWLWQKQLAIRLLVIPIFVLLTASGIIDLAVIKNDFAYPAFTGQALQTVAKIKAVLPQKAVVVSFREMYHPVALAGRKQFFGFFSSPEVSARAAIAQQIFLSSQPAELIKLLDTHKITHLLLPKEKIADFPYRINEQFFRNSLKLVYEDQKYLLLTY